MFGRNVTLSGRTEIWNVLMERQIAARPLLGYGFWSFWDPDAARVTIFKRLIRYRVRLADPRTGVKIRRSRRAWPRGARPGDSSSGGQF